MSNNSKHDKIVDNLEERLIKNENYEYIGKNIEYKTKKYEGEFDIILYNSKADKWHYYEVKSNYTNENWKKANEQINRARKAYPNDTIRGIFVSPQYIKRI